MRSAPTHSEPGFVDRAWDAATRPVVAGLLLLGTGLFVALDATTDGASYVGVARVLATLSVGAAVALAARLIEGPGAWSPSFVRQALGAGLIRRTWLPFFDDELHADGQRALERMRAARVSVPAALAVCWLLATPGVLVLVHNAPEVSAGRTTVAVGNTAETFELERVAPGVSRNLGLKIELARLSHSEDGRWLADLIVRDTASDTESRVQLRAGDRVRLRGRVLALDSVQALARAGRVLLTLSSSDGGAGTSVAFPVGGQHELSDGTVVSVPEATLSFARQLGPAARVVELVDGEVTSDRWVFASDADFDGRHAAARWSAALDEVEPLLAATLVVSDVVATPLRPGVSALIWLGVLAAVMVLAARRRPLAVGTSGDYAVYVVGWFAGGDPARRAAHSLLTATQVEELDAVIGSLAPEDR